MKNLVALAFLFAVLFLSSQHVTAQPADTVLIHGKVLVGDDRFSIRVTWGMYNNDAPSDEEKNQLYGAAKRAAERGMGLTQHWNNDRSVHHLLEVFWQRLVRPLGAPARLAGAGQGCLRWRALRKTRKITPNGHWPGASWRARGGRSRCGSAT